MYRLYEETMNCGRLIDSRLVGEYDTESEATQAKETAKCGYCSMLVVYRWDNDCFCWSEV